MISLTQVRRSPSSWWRYHSQRARLSLGLGGCDMVELHSVASQSFLLQLKLLIELVDLAHELIAFKCQLLVLSLQIDVILHENIAVFTRRTLVVQSHC